MNKLKLRVLVALVLVADTAVSFADWMYSRIQLELENMKQEG